MTPHGYGIVAAIDKCAGDRPAPRARLPRPTTAEDGRAGGPERAIP